MKTSILLRGKALSELASSRCNLGTSLNARIYSLKWVEIDYGEPVETGGYRGTFKTIGDKEHTEIIQLYASGLSINKISKQIGRSTKSIKDHIDSHNLSVDRSAFCPACRRVHSNLEGKKAERT